MTTDAQQKQNYKSSLNLPQTAFPMEAKLTSTEPTRLARWKEARLYEKLITHRSDGKKWILHDGPPFANGDIHLGHVINKNLKDVILRFRSMQGFQTPYVPGWDCHGLPIEHKIQQELGPKLRQMSVVEVRKLCSQYAEKYVKIQSEQFQRLGILGEWENPYLTMDRVYEAQTLEVFAKAVEAGLVYKQLKPVPWSIENQTALADAELEYQDVTDNSVFVELPIKDDEYLLIWTTTPWTLPANLAVAVHPQVEYAQVTYTRNGKQRKAIVACDLVDRVFKDRAGIESHSVVQTFSGKVLADTTYRHPFISDARTRRVVLAEYVTTTDGTGLVHTAPGHGEDDYDTGVRESLEVYSPVLANGRFDDTAPEWLRGKTVWESNAIITKKLADDGFLFAEEKIAHSYPHDWRSKKPIIFRATEQWFLALDKPFKTSGETQTKSLRKRALDCVNKEVEFVPAWGKARLVGMLESRPDWCVSRQRAWGLPIPVFYNEKGQALLTPASVRAVSRRIEEHGSDAWFNESPSELLGDHDPGPEFPKDKLRKEKDIFDVWFESGSSWNSVLKYRTYLNFPADLYLEGSDQHRGWFQLSLLPSLSATGQAPYKRVLTHGFVVKPDGTKVSKSDKEYVTAMAEVNRHGADLLRLWCCSVDYQNDVPASPKVISEFADKYRKIRNTLRYLLSNLYDFNPRHDSVDVPNNSLDGWASAQLDQLIFETTAAYEGYQLHRVFRLLHDFCAVEISAVYGNAMKDRLYCEVPNSPKRRRCQTVMHQMASVLTRMLAPMLIFTADESWEFLPHKFCSDAAAASVHLCDFPTSTGTAINDPQKRDWEVLMNLRSDALMQLDNLKKSAGMNKPLDAELIYRIGDAALRKRLESYGPDLEDIVGAGCHSFGDAKDGIALEVVDRRQTYNACARSWKRRPDVGSDAEYPDLSSRDADAVRRHSPKPS